MNRIHRIAAAAAIGTALLTPTAASIAYAEPYPWHQPGGPAGASASKAQIEHQEQGRLRQSGAGDKQSALQSVPDSTGFPWEIVSLAALGAGVAGAGAVSVTRRLRGEPHPV